ncbi:FAD-dependent monooxygenase [Halioxenophilus sp. WMMB6]|uniref:FAD-dependent monooxygenase n=1 Tax=Halioxenophilus sp. WMMB6 TaxID=3073815 RepID=UPI00295F4E78|nr:FAD-dependent monooxygenase [Halioxenophilus sp. WMMB6]
MDQNRRVLISGASIAGPALAYWLQHYGYTPTLVERAPGPRPGGHAIDVRGSALEVLRAMGLLEATLAHRATMKGVSKLNSAGEEYWRSEEMTITGGNFDNEDIEILRDDLANILLQALSAETEFLYGNAVQSLQEGDASVLVNFEDGSQREFDLVVAADGIGSSIRRSVFGPDDQFLLPLGVALAVFSAPNYLGLEHWQLSYQGDKHSAMLYTARDNQELRVCMGLTAGLGDIPRDLQGQKDLVQERCGVMGWEVPKLLTAMQSADDFYIGLMAQVKMPAWTKGRVALVGDAGYCPSPYSGQGTSLALVGAYSLAYQLAQSPADYQAAFARYDCQMRPYVEANQAMIQLSQDPRFGKDPAFYAEVQAAMDKAKYAVTLEGEAA